MRVAVAIFLGLLILHYGGLGALVLALMLFAFGLSIGYVEGESKGNKTVFQRGTEHGRQQKDEEWIAVLRAHGWTVNEQSEPQRERPRRAPRQRIPKHWKVLGLKPWASAEEIKTRYRELAMKLHPDRGGSVDKMTVLNDAHDTILRERGLK